MAADFVSAVPSFDERLSSYSLQEGGKSLHCLLPGASLTVTTLFSHIWLCLEFAWILRYSKVMIRDTNMVTSDAIFLLPLRLHLVCNAIELR